MEPTVLSGPLGHTQWESEQPFPLGFLTLDSDNGGVLCQNKTGQTGLDFRNSDHDHTSQHTDEGDVFQDKSVELDNLLNICDFSCGDVLFEEDQSTNPQASLHSTHIEDVSITEKNEGHDEISDFTLSWLFSPNLTDVVGKNFAFEELNLTQEASPEGSNALSGEAELISLSETSSPSEIPERNSETNPGDPCLLVDLLSSEPSCLTSESSCELNPQGVSEELVDLSQEEQAGPPPAQSRETLSPETGDKGLFPDQVTALPLTGSSTLQGLPESCLPHNHISTPLECIEGFVPLLDLEVPDCDSSLSLCPAGPASVICTSAPLDLSTEESEVEHAGATVIRNLTSEQQGENDSLALSLSAEPSVLTEPLTEDVCNQGDFTSESNCVENESEDLMEDKISSEAKNQGNEEMALDLCLATDEETWDLKPPEHVQNESVPDSTTEQREEKRLTDINQLQGADCHEVAPFDFSVQELSSSSPQAGWTSEQTVETISLSKMVVDDSLPMVSAVNKREEDVSPLKAVFDALDQDGDGFVRIEEFMEFAAAYGADQVRPFSVAFPCLSREFIG